MRARSPQRIGVVHSNADYLTKLRLPFMQEMVRRGHEVLGFAPGLNDHHRRLLQSAGVEGVDFTLDPVGMNPLRDIADTLLLSRLFRRHALDIVVTNTAKPVIFGSFAALLAGVPARYAMITGLGSSFADRSGTRRRALRNLVSFLYRAALSLNERVIFHNHDDIAELARTGVLDPRRAVRVNGSGVVLDRWVFERPERRSPLTFLFVGRLLREKGVVDLVDAMRLLRQQGQPARCVLVGDVDRNPSALRREEIRAWADEGVVEWAGYQRDLGPWLAQADVFVLPSYYREGLPHACLEAMASGLPIVTTDLPGCRDVVAAQNGILVPPQNPPELAAAMLRFIEEPGLAAQMGRNSRALAEERFDVHKVNDTMIGALGLGYSARALSADERFAYPQVAPV